MAGKPIAENRRARFDYFLDDAMEAGLALTGRQVTSLRAGQANTAESYAPVAGGRTGRLVAGGRRLESHVWATEDGGSGRRRARPGGEAVEP